MLNKIVLFICIMLVGCASATKVTNLSRAHGASQVEAYCSPDVKQCVEAIEEACGGNFRIVSEERTGGESFRVLGICEADDNEEKWNRYHQPIVPEFQSSFQQPSEFQQPYTEFKEPLYDSDRGALQFGYAMLSLIPGPISKNYFLTHFRMECFLERQSRN